ncbi:nucleotide-binding protein [Phaeobacter gallaeciensis]|uniref:TIR domain-containing protein n=1 Tax=Phaeobacter gallaeciensis TaxID=60890 RepID=UPI00237FA26B|nr:TIR domain-containing protein [Phaeobacter gallaeciensis]MDE4302081.1 nucleotide-binding protein [Phaeobacter gallaeciensis]MDE4306942.1 nucleotide-binding protein [Phaeobacter gallaeciensis]MDE4310939.1 nucleotide-binding protein [Phaeobacter gallaeciensis]MDE4315402.1 nucleotide-binding protein [Phaeobacter gallaeciensis]MDE4319866.1 nucleotide-binding protein [Phaeobacter gallaeciensis]
MAKKSKPIRVFYSWQSDLPSKTTRYAIKRSLESFRQNSSIPVVIDEATRDEAGSPNIPQTILEKIGKADVFVADVSTINDQDAKSRKCPNPNVVFELGYAVQTLGWSRIVLLFNSAYGTFPADLPFDFDRHRASPFQLADTKNKQENERLQKLVVTAVGGIIAQDPKRPSELAGLTEEQLRYSRDLRALEWVLEEMHLPTIDDHLARLPHSFPYRGLHFFEGVYGIVFGSSLFHLNDKKLDSAIRAFTRAWNQTVSRDHLYHLNQGSTLAIFSNPGDLPLPPEKEAEWQEIASARDTMAKKLQYILKRVRDDYPSIDLHETSKRAWQDYLAHHSDS